MLLVCGQFCSFELGMKLQIGRFRHLRVGSTKSKLLKRKSEERKQSSSLFLFRSRCEYSRAVLLFLHLCMKVVSAFSCATHTKKGTGYPSAHYNLL